MFIWKTYWNKDTLWADFWAFVSYLIDLLDLFQSSYTCLIQIFWEQNLYSGVEVVVVLVAVKFEIKVDIGKTSAINTFVFG